MKNILISLLFTFILALLGPTQISARYPLSIQLWTGYMNANGGLYKTLTQYHAVKSYIGDGPLYGFKFDLAINRQIETEMALGNAANYEVSIIDPSGLTEPDNTLGIETSDFIGHLQFNTNIYPFDSVLSPFISGGFGWLLFVDDASFGWSFGGGLRSNLSDRFSARALYRYFITNFNGEVSFYSTPGWDPENWGDINIPFKDRITISEFSLAIAYSFGPQK